MHQLGLIHKDIKPENIMYSPTLKKCIFIDFGISHFVIELWGDKSETFCEGSLKFMSPELLELRGKNAPGYANLY